MVFFSMIVKKKINAFSRSDFETRRMDDGRNIAHKQKKDWEEDVASSGKKKNPERKKKKKDSSRRLFVAKTRSSTIIRART